MKYFKRRALALLLSVCMVLTMMPSMVFAAEPSEEPTGEPVAEVSSEPTPVAELEEAESEVIPEDEDTDEELDADIAPVAYTANEGIALTAEDGVTEAQGDNNGITTAEQFIAALTGTGGAGAEQSDAGKTITLTKNVTVKETAGDDKHHLRVKSEFTLDLAGHTLTMGKGSILVIDTDGNLTIKNSGAEGKVVGSEDKQTIQAQNGASLTVESGSIVATGKEAAIVVHSDNEKSTKLSVNGGQISAAKGGSAILASGKDVDLSIAGGEINGEDDSTIQAQNGASLTVKSGSISAAENGTAIVAIGENTKLNIAGGNINGESGAPTVNAQDGTTVDINGGTVTKKYVEGDTTPAVEIGYGKDTRETKATISGETTTINGSVSVFGKGNLTVNGGTIKNDYGFAISTNGSADGTDNTSKDVKIKIAGGTITGANDACGIYAPAGEWTIEGETTKISGGAGIVVRGGTLNITNGIITATGSGTVKVGDAKPSARVTAAGISVDKHSGYQDGSVSITGGTIQANMAGTPAVVFSEDGKEQSPGEDSKIDDKNTITITGGTYPTNDHGDPSVEAFLDDTYYLNEEYTVAKRGQTPTPTITPNKVTAEEDNLSAVFTVTNASDYNQKGDVTVSVYDENGSEIASGVTGTYAEGRLTLKFDKALTGTSKKYKVSFDLDIPTESEKTEITVERALSKNTAITSVAGKNEESTYNGSLIEEKGKDGTEVSKAIDYQIDVPAGKTITSVILNVDSKATVTYVVSETNDLAADTTIDQSPSNEQGKITISYTENTKKYISLKVIAEDKETTSYYLITVNTLDIAAGDAATDTTGIAEAYQDTLEPLKETAITVDDTVTNAIIDGITDDADLDNKMKNKGTSSESVAGDNSVWGDLKEANPNIQDAEINYFYVPELVITVEEDGYDEEAGKLMLDITPMYYVIATTAETSGDAKLTAEDAKDINAVKLTKTLPLTNLKNIEVKIPVPAGVGKNDSIVYVRHANDPWKICTVKNSAVTLTVPSFSPFTLVKDIPGVATIDGDDTVYENLQDAINAVKENGTIHLTENAAPNDLQGMSAPTSGVRKFSIVGTSKVNVNDIEFEGAVKGGNTYTAENRHGEVSVTISDSGLYAISVKTDGYGRVIVPDFAEEGEEVSFTIEPNSGYRLKELKVSCEEKDVPVNGDSFYMPKGDVVVEASFEKTSSGPVNPGTTDPTTPTTPPTVEVPTTTNGTASVDKPNAIAGDTVKITPKANEGYEVDQVTVTDKNGNEIEVKDNGDGTYSFVMPADAAQPVTVSVTFKESEGGEVTPPTADALVFSSASQEKAIRNRITTNADTSLKLKAADEGVDIGKLADWTVESDNEKIVKVQKSSNKLRYMGAGTAHVTVTAKGDNDKVYSIVITIDVKPGTPTFTLSHYSSKKARTFTVTTSTVRGATGFEVRYSLKKSLKSSKTKRYACGKKLRRQTIKANKTRRTYYVRVRAYQTVDGKRVYGAWSKLTKRIVSR